MIVVTIEDEGDGGFMSVSLNPSGPTPGGLTQLPCTLGKRVAETPGDALEVVDALEWVLCQGYATDESTPKQIGKLTQGRIIIADILDDLQQAARGG